MWKSKLKVKHIVGTKKPKMYELTENLIWDDIVVKKGFKTDFASVPTYLTKIFPPMGKYSKASVVHDFMYSVNWFSKDFADKTFYEIMINDGTRKITAIIFYYSVVIFGGNRYAKS